MQFCQQQPNTVRKAKQQSQGTLTLKWGQMKLKGLRQEVTFPTWICLETSNETGQCHIYLELLEDQKALYNIIGFLNNWSLLKPKQAI